jgi:hypothetical protein
MGLNSAQRDDRLRRHGNISCKESRNHSKTQSSGTKGSDDTQASSGWREGSHDPKATRRRTKSGDDEETARRDGQITSDTPGPFDRGGISIASD